MRLIRFALPASEALGRQKLCLVGFACLRKMALMRAYRAERQAGRYAAALCTWVRVRRAADAVFDGVWLGLLDRSALQLIDETFYASATETIEGQQRSYHETEHIAQGLSDWERAAADRFPSRSESP